MLLFFDTETTGLNIRPVNNLTSKLIDSTFDEVIQFSAILCDYSFNIIRIINRYCSTEIEIDPEALAVHHLTNEAVNTLSFGKNFATIVEEERIRDLKDITWVGYNSSFDKSMINQTLSQQGSDPINFGRALNLLKTNISGIHFFDAINLLRGINGTKYKVSLAKLIEKHITDFSSISLSFNDRFGISSADNLMHNAIYDTLGLALLVHKFKNNLFE